MKEFCEMYNLKNLIKDPCYINPSNPSSIDLMLMNRPRKLFNIIKIESGLSDHHKLTISVLKSFFQKLAPISLKHRDYKEIDLMKFRMESLSNIKELIMTFSKTYLLN